MRKTSVYRLRDNLAAYLNEIASTEVPLVVYKFKKPVAIIIPPKKELINEDYNSYYGFLGGTEKGEEFVKRVRRSKKEKEYVKSLRGSYD